MYGFQQPQAGQAWIYKDPQAVLDYAVDWSEWLGGDPIASVIWSVPAGITKTLQTQTDTRATAWLSGGTAGQSYAIGCRITTQAGRTAERSFRVICREM